MIVYCTWLERELANWKMGEKKLLECNTEKQRDRNTKDRIRDPEDPGRRSHRLFEILE